jgi:hypothetical protein
MSKLTFSKNFDINSIIYSKAKEFNIPKSTMVYHRITMSTKYLDGTIGPLIIPTNGQLFSFGVSENKSLETGKLTGYSLSLCLHSRDGATEEEKEFVKVINDIVESATEHMLKDSTKKEVRQYKLVKSDLRKMNPIYQKEHEGKIVEGSSPVLYPKLITGKDKKTGELYCRTTFYEEGKYEEDGEPTEIQLKDLVGQYCYVMAAISFESIYIGSDKHRIQFKLVEADIRKVNSGKSNLLRKKRVGGMVSKKVATESAKESVDLELSGDDEL